MNTILNPQVDLKKALRDEALKKRDAIPMPVRRIKAMRIKEELLNLAEFRQADKVLLYASFRSEVDTSSILEEALKSGKKVLLPKVNRDTGTLTKHIIGCLDDISSGYMGIPEPDTDICMKVEEIDIIIVPCVALDAGGRRIGYGGGYYDRLLLRIKGIRTIVALAFEEQIFDALPHEEHDMDMDIIITDKRLIDCRG